MIPVTLDASVIVKWFYPVSQESDLPQAQEIQRAYAADAIALFQPPHWRAEVSAVLVRLSRTAARRDVTDLCSLDVETVDSLETLLLAATLASRYSQHLFDTLYHAVALSVPGCRLVTADTRYFQKARDAGRVVQLCDWQLERGAI